jgi:hypothetical protein
MDGHKMKVCGYCGAELIIPLWFEERKINPEAVMICQRCWMNGVVLNRKGVIK